MVISPEGHDLIKHTAQAAIVVPIIPLSGLAFSASPADMQAAGNQYSHGRKCV